MTRIDTNLPMVLIDPEGNHHPVKLSRSGEHSFNITPHVNGFFWFLYNGNHLAHPGYRIINVPEEKKADVAEVCSRLASMRTAASFRNISKNPVSQGSVAKALYDIVKLCLDNIDATELQKALHNHLFPPTEEEVLSEKAQEWANANYSDESFRAAATSAFIAGAGHKAVQL